MIGMERSYPVGVARTPRQRQVMELRSSGLNFAAIGRRLGISGERVRQIEKLLLRRARQFYALSPGFIGQLKLCVSLFVSDRRRDRSHRDQSTSVGRAQMQLIRSQRRARTYRIFFRMKTMSSMPLR
jgi:hypothetical protein